MAGIRRIAPGDAGWVLQRHGEHYCAGLGFDRDFEVRVAEILAGFLRAPADSADRGWIARDGDTRLGCVFCCTRAPGIGQLRLFFVEPVARGTGVAQALFDTLLAHGRACEWTLLRLWTHAEHVEAGCFYRRNGFVRVAGEPVRSFGKTRIVECFERPVDPV